jgi:ubiquinol-cytochrome c reductase iron-sulfur subunit
MLQNIMNRAAIAGKFGP